MGLFRGLFPDLLVCSPCDQIRNVVVCEKKKTKKKVSSCTKEEAGFSGFNFSAAGFWI